MDPGLMLSRRFHDLEKPVWCYCVDFTLIKKCWNIFILQKIKSTEPLLQSMKQSFISVFLKKWTIRVTFSYIGELLINNCRMHMFVSSKNNSMDFPHLIK